jgi:hypothetical protein
MADRIRSQVELIDHFGRLIWRIFFIIFVSSGRCKVEVNLADFHSKTVHRQATDENASCCKNPDNGQFLSLQQQLCRMRTDKSPRNLIIFQRCRKSP